MAVIEDQIHEHEANNNTLCDDIVEQILRKLPVKSLLRFKAACKSWCNLISSPKFANLTICRDHNVSRIHLSGYNCSHRVELGETERDAFHEEINGNEGLPWYFSVPSIDTDSSDIQVVEIFNPFDCVPDPDLYSIHVAGSCNGVLFVTIQEDTFLWNPLTREHVKISPTNAMHDLFCRFCSTYNTIAGLGYNSVFDEYKAILFLVAYCDPDELHSPIGRSQLLIYSSKVGCWKEVDDQDVSYCFCKTLDLGITVNGCPHWIVHDCKDYKYSKPIIILYFDTVDDKLKRLPTPIRWCDYYYDEHDVFPSPSLSVLGRCLCATLNNLIDNTTDVWVMNKYGEEDSWNKLFVIPVSIIQGFQIVPLGFMNHGDELVLEVNQEKIMTYNLKTKAQKFVIGTTTDHFYPPRGIFNSVDYVTSSVSPRRFLHDEKQKQEEKKGVS